MSKYENGITKFTTGIATIKVHFPKDDIKCQWCAFCRSESDLKRHWCRLTNEMLYNPYGIYRGQKCPIKFEEKEDNNE